MTGNRVHRESNSGAGSDGGGEPGIAEKNVEFHSRFPEIPEDEYLIAYDYCRLRRGPPSGTLFISKNYVCYYSDSSKAKFSIPIYDITMLQKNTYNRIYYKPLHNALQITNMQSEYCLSVPHHRDRMFSVIHKTWRAKILVEGSGDESLNSKETTCMCSKVGQHHTEIMLDTVLFGTPKRIHDLIFAKDFIEDFMRNKQGFVDIQMSNWAPTSPGALQGLLTQSISYVYLGTKYEIRDEVVHCDFDDYISITSTRRFEDGSIRMCIMWDSAMSSRIIVTAQLESTFPGKAEQVYHYNSLVHAISTYIRLDHQFKFKPEEATVNDIQRLLSLETALNTLLALEASKISPVLDLLQAEIKNRDLDHKYRQKCGKCLRLLVNKHHILPSSLFINEVTMEDQHPLAVGGYSDIYKGTSRNELVCLKVLRIQVQSDEEQNLREFYKEALLWTQLSHPSLLPFLGVNTTLFPRRLCLVSPWMANGQITKFLEINPSHNRLRAISEIAAGISYLHSHNIVHGDIKGANILVDEDGQCYLADFGLAIASMTCTLLSTITKSSVKGTMRWMAPELFYSDDASTDENAHEISKPENNKPTRDIYAYACTVYEIITGKPPFVHLSDVQVMLKVIDGRRPARPAAINWCPDNIWALVQQCWAHKSWLRPTASDIHAFLSHLEQLHREGLSWEQQFPISVMIWQKGQVE